MLKELYLRAKSTIKSKVPLTSPNLIRCFFVLSILVTITIANQDHNEMENYSQKLGLFSSSVYNKLAQLKPDENIVFSPFSIQTCGAMVRLGAEAETAAQLDRGLYLPYDNDLEKVAETFHEVLAHYENSDILKIANKIYVMRGYTIQQSYNDLLTKKFLSTADEINFAESQNAAKTMNNWIESKTNNLIKDLIPASALNELTRLVLLNAIHFKGKWKHPFPKSATYEEFFYLNKNDKVKVNMMSLKHSFRYADMPELNAQVLEMPYENTDLSMLIILPRDVDGLKSVEQKLQNISLADITRKMYTTKVIVKMPKFKAEFEVELSDVFKELGMSRMFSDNAEFGRMLEKQSDLKVSKVLHKAYIDVNEEGTEAAAATGMIMCFASMPMFVDPPKEFFMTRPFYYQIHNSHGIVLFGGSVHKF